MLSINERKTTNEQMRSNCIVRSERHRFALLLSAVGGCAWVGKLQRTFTHTHIDRMAPGPHSRKIVLLLEHVPKHY